MLHLRKGQGAQIFAHVLFPLVTLTVVEATRACISSRTSYFGRISLVVTYRVTNYRRSYLGKNSQVQLGGRTEEG